MINEIGISVSIVSYMILMLAIGIWSSKQNASTDDFYLGGRRLGPIVTAMSAEASDMSSWLLMGLPGIAYISGLADASWTAIGLALGTYLNWLLVAKRLRRYTIKANNSITIPSFFANRFRDKSRILLAVSAIWILIFFIPYTASGFAACGKLFHTLFGVNYILAMLVSAAVIILYTMLGGFLAASTTDLVQSIVMTVALVIVVLFGINAAGGLDRVLENARGIAGYLSLCQMGNSNAPQTATPYTFMQAFANLAWGLGYFGMPHILLRFMAIGDEKKIKVSRRIASVWVLISMAVAIFIGIVANAMSKAGAIAVAKTSADAENSIIRIAHLLSGNGLGFALLAGVILAGILACTMSTSDSQLLAASSSFSENLLVEVFGLSLTEKQRVLAARLTVIAIALLSIFIARDPDSSVFAIVSFAWAGFGAAFGPVMLLALFWRRANRYGAIAGMISGGVMVFAWKYLVRPLGGVWDIYELLPAFLVSALLMIAVSLVTPAPSREMTEEFDAVCRGD